MNLIITRFNSGSAGKFLSTVLQNSNTVDHWESILQQYKQDRIYTDLVLEYVNRSFPKDAKYHLRCEPIAPYDTHFYSSTFSRGFDISVNEYNIRMADDLRFNSANSSNLILNLIFHTVQIPKFCVGSKCVTILAGTELGKNWVFESVKRKHFMFTDSNIIYLPNSPAYSSFKSLPLILSYNNSYKFDISDKDKIFDELKKRIDLIFNNTNEFAEFDHIHDIDTLFIDIEVFFNTENFKTAISNIFDKFNLGKVNLDLVGTMHKLWWSRQII